MSSLSSDGGRDVHFLRPDLRRSWMQFHTMRNEEGSAVTNARMAIMASRLMSMVDGDGKMGGGDDVRAHTSRIGLRSSER